MISFTSRKVNEENSYWHEVLLELFHTGIKAYQSNSKRVPLWPKETGNGLSMVQLCQMGFLWFSLGFHGLSRYFRLDLPGTELWAWSFPHHSDPLGLRFLWHLLLFGGV